MKFCSGPTLEEIAKIFDGKDAQVGSVETKDGLTNVRGGSVDKNEYEQQTIETKETA